MRLSMRCCLLLLAFSVFLCGQVNFAAIAGQIRDLNGGAVAGATLTLVSPDTGFRRVTQSNQDGMYEFAGLNPGSYRLEIAAHGFAVQQRTVTLDVNQRPHIDVVLSLQKVDQTIQVSGAAATLRTSDASLGEVIEPEMIHQLPLNGGHFLELALLAPTAHMSHGAQTGMSNPLYWRPGQDSALSTGGGRANANYYLLDGSNNTDPTFNTISLSPATDDIQEFKIQTGSYSAEFGGAGGAQINVITRSGNNHYHGDVYEFLRNSALDARSFNQPGKIPHLDQNQFGGSFGGPIQRDRTFFFFNYEGLRMNNQMNMMETVPTAMERTGDFSQSGLTIYNPFSSHANPNYDSSKPVSPSNAKVIRDPFPNDAIPSNLISPVALAALNAIPLPNLEMGGMGGGMNMSGPGVFGGPDSNNYLDTRSEHHVTDQYNLRIDHNFAGGDSLFARYSLSNEHGFTPQNLPGFGAYHDNRAQNLTIYHTHVLSPESVNTAWFDMNRLAMHRYSENANKNDYVSQLGIQGVGFGGAAAWGMPYFNIQGYDPIGDSILATPMNAWDTVFQAGDIMNWQVGSHSLKWGGDYRRFLWPMLGFFQNRGYYQFTPGFTSQTATNDHTGASLADFLLGLPVVKQRQAGIPTMDMRQWYASGFVQDDWRVGPNTTVNLGLRYEFMSALHDISKPLTNLTYVNGQPYAFIGGQEGMPQGLMFANKTNFAPRLGLAQALPQWGMVVRAGYGLFFTPVDMNTWCNQVHNPPLVFAETRQSDNYTPSLFGFDFGPATLGTTPVSMAAVDPHSPAEYISQWSLSVQKSLPAALVLEVGYQGSRGYHLQRSHLINNALPGAGPIGPRRPIQTLSFLPGTVLPGVPAGSGNSFPVSGINLLENSANSWYDAGWVEVRRRSSLGVTLLANYTWSKNLSDAPDFRSPMFESAIPQNNNDLAAEKGLACDLRQRAVVSLVYELPGVNAGSWVRNVTSHWEVASIYQVQSGFPFTVSVFGDTANSGTLLGENPIRANYTGAPVFPSGTHTTAEWFNPAAFAAPPAYQFGDVGRNTIEGPGMQVLDLAMTREFVLGRETHLQVRGELFNGLNHTNLGTPNRFVNTPQFGTITDAATPGRQIQLSARYTF